MTEQQQAEFTAMSPALEARIQLARYLGFDDVVKILTSQSDAVTEWGRYNHARPDLPPGDAIMYVIACRLGGTDYATREEMPPRIQHLTEHAYHWLMTQTMGTVESADDVEEQVTEAIEAAYLEVADEDDEV